MITSADPAHIDHEASLIVFADCILCASGYQSIAVPMPSPPSMPMNIIVTNHATGKSPSKSPVKLNGLSFPASPITVSFSMIAEGPPAVCTPQNETITITIKAMIPCWKSAITTPQYPAARTYMAQAAEKTIRPIQSGQSKRYWQTFPIAMPTQPRMNMLRKTCQPATQPRRSSPDIPPNLSDCHSACV